jgi:ribosomal protein S15
MKKKLQTEPKSLTDQNKIIEALQLHSDDCGSTAMQIYFITASINKMNQHGVIHKKDKSIKRTLQKLVARRNKLCTYYKKHYSLEKYNELIIQTLGLRK